VTGSAGRADTLHATCVARGARGIVITGPSGSGKSDLALQLILGPHSPGFVLVADDLVRIEAEDGIPKALAPARHAGLIEVRGTGLVTVPHVGSASIVLAVALRPWKDIERYPQSRRKEMIIAGLSVPLIEIDASSPSAAIRVGLALALIDEPGRLYGSCP
jgi:HPr kinase/phosphorylase